MGITECRLRANRTVLSNIDLQDYTYGWTPTTASKGGTLIYTDNKLRYKTRNDLKLYKEREMESTFPEIIESNKKKKNYWVHYINIQLYLLQNSQMITWLHF